MRGAGPDPLAVPSAWVRRYAHLVPSGSCVLDLAAGGGRHTRFFRERGCKVVAVDLRLDALADLDSVGGVELVGADLENGEWPLPGRRFDAIVVTNYLHRPLFPVLAASLGQHGTLIYETFARGNEQYGRPADPAFLLRPNELVEAFREHATIVGYEHGLVYAPRPAVVQRIAAVAGAEFVPL